MRKGYLEFDTGTWHTKTFIISFSLGIYWGIVVRKHKLYFLLEKKIFVGSFHILPAIFFIISRFNSIGSRQVDLIVSILNFPNDGSREWENWELCNINRIKAIEVHSCMSKRGYIYTQKTSHTFTECKFHFHQVGHVSRQDEGGKFLTRMAVVDVVEGARMSVCHVSEWSIFVRLYSYTKWNKYLIHSCLSLLDLNTLEHLLYVHVCRLYQNIYTPKLNHFLNCSYHSHPHLWIYDFLLKKYIKMEAKHHQQ